ncbi:MAG TPA: fumarylacetoacetate hydrolase family protein [Syntrophales bacterium]|nr:fumarylacetoacetate hydrolase family protein [Syntrophales bacterium]
MKICRFFTENDEICQGLYDPARPGLARVIRGDILGEWEATDREVLISRWLPPVAPPVVYALGFSYGRHAAETGTAPPEDPVVFMKAVTSVIGHREAIVLPAAGPERVDYEGELAVVIAKRAKNLTPETAMDCVFGYTCANDVSARDWQFERQKGQWTRGKGFDTFCPLGPFLVTRDEIPDPDRLAIRTLLNDRVMQDASTADMLYPVSFIVSALSQSTTLLPGTVILTGTPEGVGFTRQPPVFLREGDVVSITIEGLGTLSNPVVRERP